MVEPLSALPLDIQALFIRYGLAEFEISPQYPEIHRPAVTGHPEMIVRARPPRVGEAHPGGPFSGLQPQPYSRSEPVAVGAHHLEFELAVRHESSDLRPPVVGRSKPEFVLRTLLRVSRG